MRYYLQSFRSEFGRSVVQTLCLFLWIKFYWHTAMPLTDVLPRPLLYHSGRASSCDASKNHLHFTGKIGYPRFGLTVYIFQFIQLINTTLQLTDIFKTWEYECISQSKQKRSPASVSTTDVQTLLLLCEK